MERARRSPPGVAATNVAKRALRQVGVRSATWRPGPDFLVIGAKRGGTTSLHHYLAEHPGVLPLFPSPEKIKGTYYFTDHYDRGDRWYLSHFPTRATRQRVARRLGYQPVAGDNTPYYLYHPLAPARAAELVPDARIVALLRNPIERAFSHYKERRANGTEPLDFESALDAEESRCAGEHERILADPTYVSFAHRHQSYVDQSRYAPPLERWFAAYPREQLLVLPAEELYRDPQRVFDQVCAHLRLPPVALRAPRAHNAEPSPGIEPRVRARLSELLAPDIEAVEKLLERDMGWR